MARSLENHADRYPLKAKGESSVAAISENHFSYHRIRQYSLGASRFEYAEDINIFLERMGDYQGNPFPGNSLQLQTIEVTDFEQAVASAGVVLESFGEHFRDLKMENIGSFYDDVVDLDMYRNILKCLTLLPKLKSLVFSGCS